MKKIHFWLLTSIFLIGIHTVLAQSPKKIVIEYSDFFDVNQIETPDAALLTGNVRIHHDGAVLTCNKAYYFEKENYIKAFGNVQIVQGDTLYMNSKYAEYNGNIKQAFATGNVVMRSPDMTLATDTLNFDRNTQEAFYKTNGTITNKDNVLKSKSGRYYASQDKFQFLTAVTITNPKYVVKSNHLDYYNKLGHSYLTGPSTITSEQNFIYTEKGFYDSKKNIGHFLRKSHIKYKDRLIVGDSLYYNRNTEFASATNNVKITDSINKGIIKGHYAEIYKQKDSMFVTKRAVAINLVDKDSVYIHGKKLLITGKENNRIVRAFDNARFFKKDMSGKCDSIHSSQKTNLTQLIGKPILWHFENQMTGDVMHLIGNDNTQKLDSLKVLNNAFLVSKDTLGTGYNQVKGMNLYGKFRDNKLYEADIIKNTEVVYYMRNDNHELIGINKNVSSKINLTLDGNTIDTMTFFTSVDGDIYPEKDLPENARKLRGFVWRGDERIKTKDDIFSAEDNEMDAKIQTARRIIVAKESVPAGIDAKNLEFPPSGNYSYDDIFNNFNNRIVVDKNGQLLLVSDCKFKFPLKADSFINYEKKYPEYSKEVFINQELWNWKTMPNGNYDGGNYDTEAIFTEKELKEKALYDEVFSKYNNRIVIDKNGEHLLVKDRKFKFPLKPNSFINYQKKYPEFSKEIKINKVLWNWKTMPNGKFDGGNFDVEIALTDKELKEKQFYDDLFSKYNNQIVIDKNNQMLLVRDGKFRFPLKPTSFKNYQKRYPKYAKEIKINRVLWDWKTMPNGPYDGGNFDEK